MPRRTRAPEQWRNSILRYADEAPESLLANPQNWRMHPREQTAALKGSLTELGWIAPVIVNETTQHVIDGHARIGEAIARGEPTVPVAYVNLSEDQERLALATFDPIAAMAGTDQKMLDDLLAGLSTNEDGLSDLLASLASEQPKDLNPDDADLTPPAEPITKPGDLWLLGEHRLLCGDSTKAEDVAWLMGGERAQMVFSDPPYGIDLDPDYDHMHNGPDHRDTGRRFERLVGDDRPFDASQLISQFGDVVEQFWWGADYYRGSIPAGGSWVVWDKRSNDAGMDLDGVIGSQFELCWSRVAHKRDIARVLWSGHHGMQHEDTKLRVHPTQKPTELVGWFFERWGHAGDLVVDPFLGSGTTLIAAEQLGRRCYAMEIEPAYCDVSVRRWEHVTGKQAQCG